jgi:two-component system, OmpR family, phosphate regulon sensor histidine kinase PhoR
LTRIAQTLYNYFKEVGFSMFNFRQKVFISYLALFLVFLVLIFPFASQTVKKIAAKAMEDRATEIIERIRSAPNDEALVRRLKDQKPLIFFRVSVITNEHKVLYDSHVKRLLGAQFSQEYVVDHPEVAEAFEKGTGYKVDYSELLSQKFAYMAKAFDFHGKTYVLRTAFPYEYVAELSHDFEMGFLGLSTAVLLLFSFMTWFIINHLTRPIQQIIEAVKPYQKGEVTAIPEIKLKSISASDDFGKLAETLNSLTSKIQNQINALTFERNEKEAVLESLTEGVIAVEKDNHIAYANQSALKMLDLTKEELIGKTLNQKQCSALIERCQAEQIILIDTMEIKKLREKIYLDLIAIPKKGESGAILVMQDNSAHYKMLEMRKEFVANASHELKTPITIISGFAETLHDNPDLPFDTAQQITEKIMRNCVRMNNLVKDLLTLSDIEHLPESRLLLCDFRALVENEIQLVKDVFSDAEIDLHVTENADFYILGDSSLLEMAIFNLVENAAKYSNPPAKITLNLEHKEDWIQLKISDQGVGIPAKDLPHIFERFFRVDKARSTKIGGSGLGLSIVEMIISKHFGKISVESEEGKGTTFTVLLPVKRD